MYRITISITPFNNAATHSPRNPSTVFCLLNEVRGGWGETWESSVRLTVSGAELVAGAVRNHKVHNRAASCKTIYCHDVRSRCSTGGNFARPRRHHVWVPDARAQGMLSYSPLCAHGDDFDVHRADGV